MRGATTEHTRMYRPQTCARVHVGRDLLQAQTVARKQGMQSYPSSREGALEHVVAISDAIVLAPATAQVAVEVPATTLNGMPWTWPAVLQM